MLLKRKTDHIRSLYSNVYWNYKGYSEPAAKGKRARIRTHFEKEMEIPILALDKISCEMALLDPEESHEPRALPLRPRQLRIAQQPLNLQRPNNEHLQ